MYKHMWIQTWTCSIYHRRKKKERERAERESPDTDKLSANQMCLVSVFVELIASDMLSHKTNTFPKLLFGLGPHDIGLKKIKQDIDSYESSE